MALQIIVLKSNDEQTFEVPIEIAQMSVTLKQMLEDLKESPHVNAPIPLPNVSSKILRKVIDYCVYHHEHPLSENEVEKQNEPIVPWDLAFCQVDLPILFEIILASNYLDIGSLSDLTCKPLLT